VRGPKVLLLALLVDAWLGEPPAALHPVVWMGRALSWLEARAPDSDRARLAYGTIVACGLPAMWAAFGSSIERFAPWPLQALLLKPTFAGRSLLEAGRRVENALTTEELSRAQSELKSLVSRETDQLDPGLVAAAAIESLAENFVDSWLAPLLAYACFGLAGACAYRAANTADAMWGYHTPTYEYLGKAAARLDDAFNLLPARIGAVLLIVLGSHRCAALEVWRRDATATPSPNAGQAMAAMAGQLGVRLEKRATYVLNATQRAPGPADLAVARHQVLIAMFVSAAVALLLRSLREHD
jgi:adenosylcobinamide-phosphate synthase